VNIVFTLVLNLNYEFDMVKLSCSFYDA